MSELTILSALERTISDLDRQEEERRHENTDITDVMNWMAGVRKRYRVIAQNADTLELAPRC
ncbi:MAG: hypothetical protein QOK37_3305 [Thermoanaerobaculia bacterium]|jgi:uncharacterized protein (UPF0335 family)|nr:hypothetical protein [Thermoanaerobaculia bacterium]